MSNGSPSEPIESSSAPVAKPAVGWNRLANEFDWILRLIIGGILVWSSAAHLGNPYYFLSTVYQYKLTNAPVGVFVASYLPFLELVLAVCLLGGICRRPTWVLTSLLLLTFVGAQSSALARGLKISCGCFGPEINRPVDMMSVSFTGGLAALSIAATIACLKRTRCGESRA